MSKSRTRMVLGIIGALGGGLLVDTAMSEARTLPLEVVGLVVNQNIGQEKVWEQEITITEAGNYQLLIDEVALSAATSQLSAALISGDRMVIRAENGALSAGVDLAPGTYKLFVTYAIPAGTPWVTLKSSVLRNSSVHASATETFVNDALGENERVLRFALNKSDFLPGSDTNTLLRVFDLSDVAPAALLTQVIDSAGVAVSQAGKGTTSFSFDEGADCLLHVRFAEKVDQALLNVEIAGKPISSDDLIIVDRGAPSVGLSDFDTRQAKIGVEKGMPIAVSLRGVDLGPAADDLGVLVTTMSSANTFKFTQTALSGGMQTRSFVPDSNHLYIASYVNAGDMAVVVTVKNHLGVVIGEQLLAGDRVTGLGEFTQAMPAQYVITLKDLLFPEAFNAVRVAAVPADASVAAESVDISSAIKSAERTVNLFAGKYHVVAVSDLTGNQSGTYSFSITNGGETAFETVDTLGAQRIPAESFSLASASEILVKLFDHQYPAKLDTLSVGILDKDGIVASGNSTVKQDLQSGRYYLAVAAKSSHAGVYHLSASATDVGGTTPTPGEGEPARGVAGKGGKGGGGSLGGEWLLALVALGAFRHRSKQCSRTSV